MRRWPLRRGAQVHALHLLFQSLQIFTFLFTAPRLRVPVLVLHLPGNLLLLLLLHHLVVGRVLQLLRYLLYLAQPSKLIHVIVGHLVGGLVNGWARGWLHKIRRLELARLITWLRLLLLKAAWHLLQGHSILLHLILVLGRGIQQKALARMECCLRCVFILAEEIPEIFHRFLQMRRPVLLTRQVLQLRRVHPLVQRTGHRRSEGRRDFLALLVRSGVPPLLGVRVHASARGTLLCDELNLLETVLPLQGS